MGGGLTADVGQFVAATTFSRLPAKAVEWARIGFTDCVGVMLAGARDCALVAARQALEQEAGGKSRLAGGGTAAPARAAFVNAMAAHVLDYDDGALDGHPSGVLVPAVLSLADAFDAAGPEMVTAYVVGYETWAELFSRHQERPYAKGWHPTSAFGAPASAAACASLLRLSASQASHAVAMAGSLACGLIANFGSATKSVQVGRAAENGAMAALLALAGVTASHDALEASNGYLVAFSPSGKVDRSSQARLGTNFHIETTGLNIKRYPICYLLHRSIDAALDLRREHNIGAGHIQAIDVYIGETAINVLVNPQPATESEAKFSTELAMSAAFHRGRIGFAELTETYRSRPDIAALMRRVSQHPLPDDLNHELPFAAADHITVALNDGTVLRSREVTHARGSVSLPMNKDERWEKFADCVGDGGETGALFAQLQSIDSLAAASDLRLPDR